MKNNYYKFCQERYSLDKLNINVSNKKILFLIHDDNNNYYLKNDKFLDTDNQKLDILNEIHNLNKIYKLKIINFYPLCFCNITLVLALRTESSNVIELKQIDYLNINKKYLKMINYHKNNYGTKFISSNIKNEILMSKKNIRRYKFHENYIKKYILTEKKRKKKAFHKLLKDLIPKKKSIIDVSCGDNFDIFNIAKNKHYSLIVGNDICINYLYNSQQDFVIYTNEDIESNNFKHNSFDVAVCKNTLHHMNNINNINNTLDFLNNISKEIIIIEIMNPKKTKGLPKILNKYLYCKFLKDVGDCFLDKEQITSIIDEKYQHHDINYTEFTNILGTYMIAKISRRGE